MQIRAKDISEGSGYLSRVFKCDIILKQEDPNSVEYSFLFSVILKQPGFESIDSGFQGFEELSQEKKDKTKKDMIEIIKKFHHNEVTFYKVFGSSELQIPKCYGSGDWIPEKQSGYIIMEYLSGGKFPELHIGLTENQVLNLLKFIVKFQAIAHKNENEWKNEFTEVNFGESSDPEFGKMCYGNLKRGQSEAFIQKIDKLNKFFTDHEVGEFVGGGSWKTLGISSMLIHGDMWTNNVCFKYDYANEKIMDEILAIIDWQVVHPGNPMTDISRVLLMCCNPIIRRKLETNIIDLYIEELKKELGDEKLPFTKEELEISKRYSDLENIMFSMFMPSIHFHGLKH
uniref:CHK kinase-like domain-containing protein n=1 Tax=Panagrolaimus davidi TaxID=227884 RepID=A0A914QS57_9BILA